MKKLCSCLFAASLPDSAPNRVALMKNFISKYPLPYSNDQAKNDDSRLLAASLEEAQLESAKANDANEAKTEFLSYMSHEIRNPAAVMMNIADILATSGPLTEKQRNLIHTLQLSSESLINLLNDFLDITKIESRHIELERIPFSLYQTLQDVSCIMSASARGKGLEFALRCEPVKNCLFLGDPARLRQMMLNLCSNAIKFTDKGSVEISVTSENSGIETIKQIIISVSDSGIGISTEQKEKIFEKFSQADPSIHRKYGGTGLGLSITKRLAEAMGGSIDVQSSLGKGSIFTLRLPLTLDSGPAQIQSL
jgi:signal transduction histidine kinase